MTFVVGTGAWSVAAEAAAPGRSDAPLYAAVGDGRAVPAARLRPLAGEAPAVAATIEIDGLRARTLAAGTVGDALHALGVSLMAGDRLSVPSATALAPGLRVVLDRGVPVTLVDGGVAAALRAPRGTVGDLLTAYGITLGPRDRLAAEASARVASGATVRIVRVTDHEATVREALPYGVSFLSDPDLDAGRQAVVTRGSPGVADNTYLIRIVDGQEVERTLLGSVEITAPLPEVRVRGARPPTAPPEITAIIKGAAGRWGADADQLMRVAYCESRFDPLAYNPGHGDSGLFQFIPPTWAVNSVRAGYEGASVFDPVANANVAAWMFAHSQAWQWSCK